MQTVKVGPNEAGQRLDKLLAKVFSQAGKGFLYKMMRKKNITLNRKRCDGSERLEPGDEIQVFFSDETFEKLSGEAAFQGAGAASKEAVTGGAGAGPGEMAHRSAGAGPRKVVSRNPGADSESASSRPLDIVYEDNHILIVNKPFGILSQKAKPGDISLNELILDYLIDSGRLPVSQLRTFKPSICNRLDRNTSGLVVAGTSLAGLQIMNAVLKDRSIHKYYQCLVKGQVKERQVITGFLRKDEATNKVEVYPLEVEDSVPIMTEYLPIGGNGRATLLQVTLITGRSHQIRAHLASIGHPILGDFKYGDRGLNQSLRKKYHLEAQLLHSWRLTMPEQMAEPLGYLSGKTFYAPLPVRFLAVMEGEGIEAPLLCLPECSCSSSHLP